jgi:hypothetical protein
MRPFGTRAFSLAALVVVAAVGITTAASLAGDDTTRPRAEQSLGADIADVYFIFPKGPVRGLVLARPVGDKKETRLYVSLGTAAGEARGDLLLAGSKRRCSRADDQASHVFRLRVPAGAGNHAFRRARRSARMTGVRSLRVYEPGGSTQLACAA